MLQEGLSYPEDSAARIMQREFTAIPSKWSVGQTIDYLRENKDLPEEFLEIFIVDNNFIPIGTVPSSKVLRTSRESKMNLIMKETQVLIPVNMDKEEVGHIFEKYNLVSAGVVDKENNLYAHPDKVRKIDFKGKYLSSRGPFTVPRTPQGRPVVIQAGGSTRGKRFAARWGELIFAGYRNMEVGKLEYAAAKKAPEAAGRNPDHMKIASLMYPIAAATKSEAEDKKAAYELLSNDMDQLLLLSEALNFDFSTKGMDEGFTEEELDGLQGMQAMRDRVVSSGVKNPTPKDFMRITRRGLLSDGHTMVGGPKDIADEMEEWFHSPACDGFVVGPTHQPGEFEDFVKFVVPELQKRGVFRKDYSGSTLRDHLGLDRAAIGSWKTNYDTVST